MATTAAPVSAQPAEAPPPPAAPASPAAATPPELLESVEAVYPEAALAERAEGTVVFRLLIDPEGRVAEAEVIEPAGHGFDEAAREAVLRFRFKPALRGDQPVQARIRYAYAFKLPAAPVEPPPEVAPAPAPSTAPPGGEAPAPAALPRSEPEAVDVQIVGHESEADRLRQSAEAVNVVEMREARRETADLGEVLARTQGIAVRRDGGLGSYARFYLNGLTDDQIRFFVDGIPMELAGYPFRIGNVSVNLVERIEIYRGVVPIRFGADALGGAINLATDQTFRTALSASYQVGSYGTHRLTLDGRYRDTPTGLFVAGTGFFDVAQNNYEIDVQIPDERGRLTPATVPRFHDAYLASGGTLELGVLDKPWAKRLSVKAFASTYDKELQHNIVMSVPYGEVEYGETVYGASARYEVLPDPDVQVELVASYAHRTIDFVDDAEWVYSWRGTRGRPRRVAGEIEEDPTDQTVWQHGVFGRALVQWSLSPEHSLRASVTPTFTTRTGDERLQVDPNARDPLTAERDLFTVVSGFEYELNLFDKRLTNILLFKDYFYSAHSEEPLPGNIYRDRDKQVHRQGAGTALRYRFAPWLMAKASYEYATRLPRAEEVFGDAILITDNLELDPEVSHNVNLGSVLELKRTRAGDFSLDVNGFMRDADNLMVLLGNDRRFKYDNVYGARSLGVENAASWTAPTRWLQLDGTGTWQDVRNTSSDGTFGGYQGDRIPNRPYLFGSWAARLRFTSLTGPSGITGIVEPYYRGRYVHEFFRGWESQGERRFKQVVDSQLTHALGVTWTVHNDFASVSSTFEIDNLTDAKVYDNFGVQRPGRLYSLKVVGSLL